MNIPKQQTIPQMPHKKESIFKNIKDTLDRFEDIATRESCEFSEEEDNFMRDFDLYMAAAMRKDYPGTENLGKILTIMGRQ